MIGNGVTDWKYDAMPGEFEMSYWYGLISDDLYNQVKATCDLEYFEFTTPSDACLTLLDEFDTLTTNVNMYDVFGTCYKTPSTFELYSNNPQSKNFFTADQYTNFGYLKRRTERRLKHTPPCVYQAPIIDYLRQPNVIQQLHIYENASAWDVCSDWVGQNYTKYQDGTIGLYP
jgi:hypothetical protein